ncbi:MAG: bifunctional nuclease family protein, partial [Paramuribaculum sp.]|nr:bifunctional nuclease family protein [Paramuribaculum sp.]
DRTVTVESRPSEARARAMRTSAPIYTTRAILDETGFEVDESSVEESDGNEPEAPSDQEPKLENYAVEELERTLQKLIGEENYEEAARVSRILEDKRRRRASADD